MIHDYCARRNLPLTIPLPHSPDHYRGPDDDAINCEGTQPRFRTQFMNQATTAQATRS